MGRSLIVLLLIFLGGVLFALAGFNVPSRVGLGWLGALAVTAALFVERLPA